MFISPLCCHDKKLYLQYFVTIYIVKFGSRSWSISNIPPRQSDIFGINSEPLTFSKLIEVFISNDYSYGGDLKGLLGEVNNFKNTVEVKLDY